MKFNLKIVNLNFWPGYHRLRNLPTIKTVIDVGVGQHGTPYLYKNFPNATFISVDPLIESKIVISKYLCENNSYFINAALGTKIGSSSINVSKIPSLSSLLKRTYYDSNSEIIETREIQIQRLDKVIRDLIFLKKLKLVKPILLKIDTEGYELEVLKSGGDLLDNVDYIIVEVSLIENFENSYSFADIIDYLWLNNFSLFQILTAGDKTADLLFSHIDNQLNSKLELI